MVKTMSRRDGAMDNPDSPPCPTTPIANKVIATVPDVSFLQNSHTASSMNREKIPGTGESDQPYTYQYAQDLRLKFYQILQSSTHCNLPKVRCTAQSQCSLAQNRGVTMICKHNSTTIGRSSLIYPEDPLKLPHHYQKKEKANVSAYIPPSPTPPSDFVCVLNYRDSQNRIEKLFRLVEGQRKQLTLLELQIKILLSKLYGSQNCVTQSSSQMFGNGIKPFNLIKCHKQNNDVELQPIPAMDKVSTGVMTSFEFTIRNNSNDLDLKVMPTENLSTSDKTCRGDLSHDKSANLLKTPLEKIMERSEGRFSEQNDPYIIDSNRRVQNSSIDIVDYYIDKSVEASTGDGRTFYSNILYHINEILLDANRVCSSQTSYDAIQKRNKHQVQVLETAFSDTAHVVSPNISDQVFVLESLAYPRENCQTSIIQTSNTIVDTNASIHMKKLAAKYLGNQYAELDSVSQLQKSMTKLGSTNARIDLILENTMSLTTRNYLNNESHIGATNSKSLKQNILDISILKRQPKLL